MMRRILLAAALVISARHAFACTCAGGRPFLSGGSLVIRGRPIEYLHVNGNRAFPQAMVVYVDAVLAGSYHRKTITIWGDNGMSCVPYVTNYPLQTRWFFSVEGPFAVDGFGDENFTFSPCANGALEIIGDRAVGTFESWGPGGSMRVADVPRYVATGSAAGLTTPLMESFPRPGGAIAPPTDASPRPLVTDRNCAIFRGYDFDVLIAADGRVRFAAGVGPRPKYGDSEARCSLAAWQSVMRYCFHPAIRNGVPIPVVQRVTVRVGPAAAPTPPRR